MTNTYIQRPVGDSELRDLARLAETEEGAFFQRCPHLVAPYRERLMLAALCQGAALQFLGRGYGVKDFDVHFFYAQNPAKMRLSRAVKSIRANVGAFPAIKVDFIRTVVQQAETGLDAKRAVEQIQDFLARQPTNNAKHLAKKAVVGLYPQEVFGLRIWPHPN